jgi:hypothetical protein
MPATGGTLACAGHDQHSKAKQQAFSLPESEGMTHSCVFLVELILINSGCPASQQYGQIRGRPDADGRDKPGYDVAKVCARSTFMPCKR